MSKKPRTLSEASKYSLISDGNGNLISREDQNNPSENKETIFDKILDAIAEYIIGPIVGLIKSIAEIFQTKIKENQSEIAYGNDSRFSICKDTRDEKFIKDLMETPLPNNESKIENNSSIMRQ